MENSLKRNHHFTIAFLSLCSSHERVLDRENKRQTRQAMTACHEVLFSSPTSPLINNVYLCIFLAFLILDFIFPLFLKCSWNALGTQRFMQEKFENIFFYHEIYWGIFAQKKSSYHLNFKVEKYYYYYSYKLLIDT